MTFRIPWKNGRVRERTLLLFILRLCFLFVAGCLGYYCLALRLCLLGAVRVCLVLRLLSAMLGIHVCDLSLSTFLCCGCRTACSCSGFWFKSSCDSQSVGASSTDKASHLGPLTASPGKKPVCCGTHSESRLWGPLWSWRTCHSGSDQRKILKERSGHIRWRHLWDGAVFLGMCGLRAVVSWVWVHPTRACPATSWPVTRPTYRSVLLWLWGVTGQCVLVGTGWRGSIGQSGDAAEAARVPWHCDGDVQGPGKQWSRVVWFHWQKRTPWSAPIPITCTLTRSQPPSSCVVPWPQPASSSAHCPLQTSYPCMFLSSLHYCAALYNWKPVDYFPLVTSATLKLFLHAGSDHLLWWPYFL